VWPEITASSRTDDDEFDDDKLELEFDEEEDDNKSAIVYNRVIRSEQAIARVVPLEFHDMLRAFVRLLMPHSYKTEDSNLLNDIMLLGRIIVV